MNNYKIVVETPKHYTLIHPDGEVLGTYESEEEAFEARKYYEADAVLKENDNGN